MCTLDSMALHLESETFLHITFVRRYHHSEIPHLELYQTFNFFQNIYENKPKIYGFCILVSITIFL